MFTLLEIFCLSPSDLGHEVPSCRVSSYSSKEGSSVEALFLGMGDPEPFFPQGA